MSGTHCSPAASQIIPLVRGARWKRKSCLNATAAPGGLLAKRRLIATAVVLTTRGKSRRRGRFAGAVLVAFLACGETPAPRRGDAHSPPPHTPPRPACTSLADFVTPPSEYHPN